MNPVQIGSTLATITDVRDIRKQSGIILIAFRSASDTFSVEFTPHHKSWVIPVSLTTGAEWHMDIFRDISGYTIIWSSLSDSRVFFTDVNGDAFLITSDRTDPVTQKVLEALPEHTFRQKSPERVQTNEEKKQNLFGALF